MPAKVILQVAAGPLENTKYRFDEEMICLVGRAENCMLQLAGDAAQGVSRHHCLLDIHPPQVSICDLNSRNGTYLNGKKLESAGEQAAKTYPLASGDHIKIGNNVFEVLLVPAVHCCICHKEMPDAPDDAGTDPFQTRRVICPECLQSGAASSLSAYPSAKTIRYQTCAVCGVRMVNNACQDGQQWEENTRIFICGNCLARRTNPVQTVPMPALESRRGTNILHVPNYRVIKTIGRGGMGAVYLAESVRT